MPTLCIYHACSAHGCHSADRGHMDCVIQNHGVVGECVPSCLQLVAVSFYHLTKQDELIAAIMDLSLLDEHARHRCCPAEKQRWTLRRFPITCTWMYASKSGLCNIQLFHFSHLYAHPTSSTDACTLLRTPLTCLAWLGRWKHACWSQY